MSIVVRWESRVVGVHVSFPRPCHMYVSLACPRCWALTHLNLPLQLCEHVLHNYYFIFVHLLPTCRLWSQESKDASWLSLARRCVVWRSSYLTSEIVRMSYVFVPCVHGFVCVCVLVSASIALHLYFVLHLHVGKSKEAERKRINKELANIRSKFKSKHLQCI